MMLKKRGRELAKLQWERISKNKSVDGVRSSVNFLSKRSSAAQTLLQEW